MKNIVCFSSGGPGNFATVIEFCESNAGIARVICLITDREGIPAIDLAKEKSIQYAVFPFVENTYGTEKFQQIRSGECNKILRFLETLEKKEGYIDLIVVAFRRVLTGALVSKYAKRIINVHPADLSVYDIETRTRRYVGIGGLMQSVADGNAWTRTSIHFLDDGIDTGPLICLGPTVQYSQEFRDRKSVLIHESIQKQLSDKPALNAALQSILLAGRLKLIIL